MKLGLCEIQLPLGAAWAVHREATVKVVRPEPLVQHFLKQLLGTRKHHQPKAQKTEGTPGAKTVASSNKEATVYVG